MSRQAERDLSALYNEAARLREDGDLDGARACEQQAREIERELGEEERWAEEGRDRGWLR